MTQQLFADILKFLPELTLTAAICAVILVNLIVRSRPALTSGLAFIGVAAACGLALSAPAGSQTIFSGMVAIDEFAKFFKVLVSCVVLLIILFSAQSREVKDSVKRLGEYNVLLLTMTLGMFLMAGASNLLMMVLAIETTSLSSYVLAGFTKEAADSSEASLKYIIYGAVSTGLMLYGISLIFGLTGGALGFGDMSHALAAKDYNRTMLLISLLLIIVGFGYKISAVPFHFWTPDVYEGAPITITALLSVASKAAGFAVMIRFLRTVLRDASMVAIPDGFWATIENMDWNVILAIIAVLTMTLGNIVAVWQNNMKRMLAYSSIAHAGYMLMGVVVLNDKGIAAVLIYFVMYLFMNLGAFYLVMLIADKTGTEDVKKYNGIGYRMPFVGVALTIFLISLTGLPPTAGFIGKLYLFAAVLDARWIGLAIAGAINSVISLYYYARVIRNIFLRDPAEEAEPIRVPVSEILLTLVMLVPTLLFGLYFTPIVNWAIESVHMFGMF